MIVTVWGSTCSKVTVDAGPWLGTSLSFSVCSLAGGGIGVRGGRGESGGSVVLTTLVGKLGCLSREAEWSRGEMSGEGWGRLGRAQMNGQGHLSEEIKQNNKMRKEDKWEEERERTAAGWRLQVDKLWISERLKLRCGWGGGVTELRKKGKMRRQVEG